jgi:energy-coupling factor transporter ATP-binding protein EcfA2
MNGLKVIALKAENFKRLKAVEIKPDGSLVEIRGRNGAGKTSVLDALWVALAGKSAAPSVPIRNGAEEARIVLDLGELVVTRTFRKNREGEATTSLSVTAADGAKYGSPQTMLDKLVGSLSFDPLAFSRLEPKDQFDRLRQLVPGVDFDAIQRAHDGDMERRREINRQAREAAAAAALINVPDGTPAEPTDESALVAELETAGKTNLEIEQRKTNRARATEQVNQKRAEAQRLAERVIQLRAEADRLAEEAAQANAAAEELQERLDSAEPLPNPVNTTDLRAKIDQARATNANVAKAKQKQQHLDRAKELEFQADAITAKIEQRQKDKVAAIAAAQMPVPGISFGEGEILLNGVPFKQASDAEQLRASIAIAAAMNPKLRVIRVRDGSLLDEDSLAMVAQFAADNDLQVWAEIVDSKGTTGFVIEDGRVREAAEEQPAASDAA